MSGKSTHRKNFLARVYDAFLPSKHGYTKEQDYRHSAITFFILFTLVAIGVISVAYIVSNHMEMREDSVFVPSTTFTSDQMQTVISELEAQGFVDGMSMEHGVKAYGTHDMCQQWRDSFYEKNIREPIENADESSLLSYGVIGMTQNDEYENLTIQTLTDDTSVSVLGYITNTSTDVKEAIDAYAKWCAVLHDGQKLHVSFTNQNGDEYYSTDVSSASEIVSQLEGADTGTDSVSETNDTNKENVGDAPTE